MSYSFYNCTNLVEAPIIPDSVTNIEQTFQNCFNLRTSYDFPHKITDLTNTFYM